MAAGRGGDGIFIAVKRIAIAGKLSAIQVSQPATENAIPNRMGAKMG